MMILIAVISLGVIGAVSAVFLYAASKKFEVYEDPRIGLVQETLPGANCGACGYPGCAGFAAACVNSGTMDGLFCPVGGAGTMSKVSVILGKEAGGSAEPMVAVVRCNGTCRARPKTNRYDGTRNCSVASALYMGESECSSGCFGFGDCVTACAFNAIQINRETGLPEVIEDNCTSCGLCVKACPRNIIEIRRKGLKSRRVYVRCISRDKGVILRKACENACIGCGKCVNACAFEAITLENNLAYINFEKCRLCRKCVPVCPTGAIHETNFPPRKENKEAATATVTDNTDKI